MLIAEKCANKSSPPSVGVMKPKPLESLNHLTVPVAISVTSSYECRDKSGRGQTGHHDQGEVNCTATRYVLRRRTSLRTAAEVQFRSCSIRLRAHDSTIAMTSVHRRTATIL